MPFQRRRKCIFHWRRRVWLTIWDRVKIPRYTHRLMHRKRVTCELHDSYFRLMTIKHAIPRTAEVTHSDGQCGEILSGRLNYYITRWRQEVSRFWRPDPLVTRCGRENSTQLRGPPGLRLSSPGEQERHTAMSGGAEEVNMLQSLFSLQLPLTQTFQIKWEVYFFLKKCLRSSLLLREYVFCMYMCIYAYLLCAYTTFIHS